MNATTLVALFAVVAVSGCSNSSSPADRASKARPEPSPQGQAPLPASSVGDPVHGAAAHGAAAHGDSHWDEIYRNGSGFEHLPNRTLVAAVEGVAPGAALDLGMGQGRNAVFLATRGWDVTGVDTSSEGVRQAAEAAQAAGVGGKLHAVLGDISTFELGSERWDLIALIYMDNRTLADKIKRGLKRGGRVVVEFFHKDSNDYFPHPINGFETGELDRLFDGFKILRSEVVEDIADFGKRPASLVRFVAQKP